MSSWLLVVWVILALSLFALLTLYYLSNQQSLKTKEMIVMAVSMVCTVYFSLAIDILIQSPIHSMIIAIMVGCLLTILMSNFHIHLILTGWMNSLMGGMMGAMVTGMVPVAQWEVMIKCFSVFTFAIFVLLLNSLNSSTLRSLSNPFILIGVMVLFGFITNQIDFTNIDMLEEHMPNPHH